MALVWVVATLATPSLLIMKLMSLWKIVYEHCFQFSFAPSLILAEIMLCNLSNLATKSLIDS